MWFFLKDVFRKKPTLGRYPAFGFVEIGFSFYGSLLSDPNKILGDGYGKQVLYKLVSVIRLKIKTTLFRFGFLASL